MKSSILMVMLSLCGLSLQAAVYLRADAPDGGDGTSWSTAYKDLNTALQNLPDDKTIYISKGYYGCKNLTTHAFDTLKLYGGYLGETDGDMTRDTAEYQTIIGGAATMPTGKWTHVTPKTEGFGVDMVVTDIPLFTDGKLILPKPTGDYDAYCYAGTSFAFRINTEVIADGIVFFGFGREGNPGGSAIGVNNNAVKATINDCVFSGGYDLQRAILWIGTTAEESTVTKCRFYYNRASYSSNPHVIASDSVVFENCEFVGAVVAADAPTDVAFEGGKSVSNSLFTHNLAAMSVATGVNVPLIDLKTTGAMRDCVVSNNFLSIRHSTDNRNAMIFAGVNAAISHVLVAKNRIEVDAHDGAAYALAGTCNMMTTGGPYKPVYEDVIFADNVMAAKAYSLESGSFALGIVGGSTANRTIADTLTGCTFYGNAIEATPPEGVAVTRCCGVLVPRLGGTVSETVTECVFKGEHADGVYDIAQYGTTGTKTIEIVDSTFVDDARDIHTQAMLQLTEALFDVRDCSIRDGSKSITFEREPFLFAGKDTGYAKYVKVPDPVKLTFALREAGVFVESRTNVYTVVAQPGHPFPTSIPAYTVFDEYIDRGWPEFPETVPEEECVYKLKYVQKVPNEVYVVPGGSGAQDGTSWDDAFGDLAAACAKASELKYRVRLQGGTYSLSAAAPLLPNLEIVGGFEGETILGPAAAKGEWAFTDDGVTSEIDCSFKNVTFTGFYFGAIKAGSGFVRNLTIENCRFVGNGTQKSKDNCRTVYLKDGKLTMRDSLFDDDYFSLYLYSASADAASVSVIERCTFRDIAGGQKCAAIRVEGFGAINLSNSVFKGCHNDSMYTGAAAAIGMELNNSATLGSEIADCTFTNCLAEGLCYGIVRAVPKNSVPLWIRRCNFVGNRVTSPGGVLDCASGDIFIEDCAFVGNELETGATASGTGASAVRLANAANTRFVNCTFDGNCCDVENAELAAGTLSSSHHNAHFALIHCVFLNSKFTGAAAAECADVRISKEGTYAFTRTQVCLANTILWNESADYRAFNCTDTATDTAMAFANCRIKNYDFETYSTFMAAPIPGNKGNYGYVVDTSADDPVLGIGKIGENGVYAVCVSVDSPVARAGVPVRWSTGGGLYLREVGGWRNVLDRYNPKTDEQVADVGVTLDAPAIVDAWAQTRHKRHPSLGPLQTPPLGLMLLVW